MNHVISDIALKMLINGQNVRLARGVCTTEEAMHMLGIGKTEFYRRAGEKQSKLRPSKKQGKWILSSVRREFFRIHGERYEEAI